MQMAIEHTGLSCEEIAGIGDSMADWEFMKDCGFKACPSNGSEELMTKVDYVSPFPDTKGTADIIRKTLD